jgi:hypothetical protein
MPGLEAPTHKAPTSQLELKAVTPKSKNGGLKCAATADNNGKRDSSLRSE